MTLQVSNTMTTEYRLLRTVLGTLRVVSDAGATTSVEWVDELDRAEPAPDAKLNPRLAPDLCARLVRASRGEEVDFSDVPTPPGPDFHRRCWEACRAIPRGQTRTYGQLATMAGSTTGAARSAGQAMRTNRVPIIVPCHRVTASTGLGGFAGCTDPTSPAMRRKTALLRAEGALTAARR